MIFYTACSFHLLSYIYHMFSCYGVATISRLRTIIGLFCRILSLLQGSFAKETYHSKEPTNRSYPLLLCFIHLSYTFVLLLFYRALLQMRPIIPRSLLIVATPYCYVSYIYHILSCYCYFILRVVTICCVFTFVK